MRERGSLVPPVRGRGESTTRRNEGPGGLVSGAGRAADAPPGGAQWHHCHPRGQRLPFYARHGRHRVFASAHAAQPRASQARDRYCAGFRCTISTASLCRPLLQCILRQLLLQLSREAARSLSRAHREGHAARNRRQQRGEARRMHTVRSERRRTDRSPARPSAGASPRLALYGGWLFAVSGARRSLASAYDGGAFFSVCPAEVFFRVGTRERASPPERGKRKKPLGTS